MESNRRTVLLAGMAATAQLLSPHSLRAAEPEVGDNGLHVQDWFVESFLDLQEDLTAAADNSRHFAVLWEQRGCPYCRELHAVNLVHPGIVSYLQENFELLQLDLWGSRAVTDFDGEELEERALARKWQINFTPTVVFFPSDPQAVAGRAGRVSEVARMPGYFKPFHFVSMFEFVRSGQYQEQSFQRYLQEKLEQLKAEGKSTDDW